MYTAVGCREGEETIKRVILAAVIYANQFPIFIKTSKNISNALI